MIEFKLYSRFPDVCVPWAGWGQHKACGSRGGEGGAFRAARTTWTPDRAGGGGGGNGIASLRRRRISLRRQSPPPTPTTHSVAVDSHITHTSPPTPKPSETTGRPTLLSGLRRASSSPDRRGGRRFQPWSGHRWPPSCSWACTPCSTRARSRSTVRSRFKYYYFAWFFAPPSPSVTVYEYNIWN